MLNTIKRSGMRATVLAALPALLLLLTVSAHAQNGTTAGRGEGMTSDPGAVAVLVAWGAAG
jgi:hypothetical protein